MVHFESLALTAEKRVAIPQRARARRVPPRAFARSCALQALEDLLDLRAWRRAKREFEEDPTTYSAEEIYRRFLD